MADRDRTGWAPEGGGRFGLVWIAIWLVFLAQPLYDGWRARGTLHGWVGMVAVLAFAAWYFSIFVHQRRSGARISFGLTLRRAVPSIGVAYALAVVVCVAVGQSGTSTAVYIGVLCVMTLREPWSLLLGAANAVGWYAAGILVPGWTVDNTLLLSMLAAGVAVYGITQMIHGNIRLRRATEDNQRLAVSEERNRFARDLLDFLGHSLTVIRVKAELAARLVEDDPDRARAELEDLERLSRDALGDVRRAVEGYRELTLPGELTRARAALRAAEIEADLPNSTEEVPGDLRELFAWTVREGVTNVVRHSGARRCTVRLTSTSAEVCDDGRGVAHGHEPSAGNGLLGLRERAAQLGATVLCRPGEPGGHTLQVLVPASSPTSAPVSQPSSAR